MRMFPFTPDVWLWTALIVIGVGLVLRVLSRNAFLNYLGWAMLAAALGAFLAVPIWVVYAYGFAVLMATLGIVVVILLACGIWTVLWVRRSTECIGWRPKCSGVSE